MFPSYVQLPQVPGWALKALPPFPAGANYLAARRVPIAVTDTGEADKCGARDNGVSGRTFEQVRVGWGRRGERVCVVSGRGEVRDAEGVARVDGWTGNKQARVGWNGVLRLCRGALAAGSA